MTIPTERPAGGEPSMLVRVNGREVGRISVPEGATNRDIELAALALPEVQELLGDETVKGFSRMGGDAVDITV